MGTLPSMTRKMKLDRYRCWLATNVHFFRRQEIIVLTSAFRILSQCKDALDEESRRKEDHGPFLVRISAFGPLFSVILRTDVLN